LETANAFIKAQCKKLVFFKRIFFVKPQRCSQELAVAADVSVAASQSGEEEREEGSECEEELTSLEEMLGQFAPADFTSHTLGKASG
jgi:hypothetical protein